MSTITIETKKFGTIVIDPETYVSHQTDNPLFKMVGGLFDNWYQQYQKNINCAISREIREMYDGEGRNFIFNRRDAIQDAIRAIFETMAERKLETVTEKEIYNTFDIDNIFQWR